MSRHEVVMKGSPYSISFRHVGLVDYLRSTQDCLPNFLITTQGHYSEEQWEGRHTEGDANMSSQGCQPWHISYFRNSEVTVSCCSGQLEGAPLQAAWQNHSSSLTKGLISHGSPELPSQTPDTWKALRAVYYSSLQPHQKKKKWRKGDAVMRVG